MTTCQLRPELERLAELEWLELVAQLAQLAQLVRLVAEWGELPQLEVENLILVLRLGFLPSWAQARAAGLRPVSLV